MESRRDELEGNSYEQIHSKYCRLNVILVDRRDHSEVSDRALEPKQSFFWGVEEGG